MLPVLLIISC